jgi:hypothetical protein
MSEPVTTIVMAGFALAGLTIFLAASLKGWQGWLELKRLELSAPGGQAKGEGGIGELIEMADLKERIRKLESIAACVDI